MYYYERTCAMSYRLLTLVLFVSVILGGCAKKPPEANIAEWQKFEDPYFKVHFTVPAAWHRITEGTKVNFYSSEAAVQKFYDPTAKDVEDGAQLSVMYERLDTVKPLEVYVQDLRNELTVAGYTVKSVEPISIEGNPATKVTYGGQFDERTKIDVARTLTVKDSMLYTATLSGFNNYFEPCKAVLDSFIATAELPKPKEKPADPSMPSLEYDTFSNDILSIAYPNNFEPVVPPPSGEVQFVLQILGYRKDSNMMLDVRPAKKLTVEKVVEQNEKFFKPTSRGETKIDGLKAPYLNYSPARDIESRAYFVVKNDKVYRIILNYHRPSKQTYLPAFEKSVASVRIK